MTTNLSQYNADELPNADVLKRQRYAIIVADWNSDVTYPMAQGAVDTLLKCGVQEENILVQHVPGTVELTYAAAKLIRESYWMSWDGGKVARSGVMGNDLYKAVIVIGCVIKGETPHFDYVCQSVTQGTAMLNAKGLCPVIFSVLTTLDKQQALDRAGGRLGNKGVEGAVTAVRMANLP